MVCFGETSTERGISVVSRFFFIVSAMVVKSRLCCWSDGVKGDRTSAVGCPITTQKTETEHLTDHEPSFNVHVFFFVYWPLPSSGLFAERPNKLASLTNCLPAFEKATGQEVSLLFEKSAENICVCMVLVLILHTIGFQFFKIFAKSFSNEQRRMSSSFLRSPPILADNFSLVVCAVGNGVFDLWGGMAAATRWATTKMQKTVVIFCFLCECQFNLSSLLPPYYTNVHSMMQTVNGIAMFFMQFHFCREQMAFAHKCVGMHFGRRESTFIVQSAIISDQLCAKWKQKYANQLVW